MLLKTVLDLVCNLTIYWNVNTNTSYSPKKFNKVCNLTIYWNVNETNEFYYDEIDEGL